MSFHNVRSPDGWPSSPMRAAPRQLQAAREEQIERHGAAVVRLAPHPEVTREAVPQHIAGARIGADGEADGGSRAHVRRAPHGPPERLLEHACRGGKFGAAAGHIEHFDGPSGCVASSSSTASAVRSTSGRQRS